MKIIIKKFVEVGRGADRTTKTEFDWKQEFPIEEDDTREQEEHMRDSIKWCIDRVPRHLDGTKYLYSIEWTSGSRVLIRFGWLRSDDPDVFYEVGRFYVFYLEE